MTDKLVVKDGSKDSPFVSPFQFSDPKVFTEAGRLNQQWSQTDTAKAMEKFPNTTIGSDKPGVERVERNGKIEYDVRAGRDPVQNAAWVQDAVRQAERSGGGNINLSEGIYRGNISVRGDNISIKGTKDKTVFDMGDRPVSGSESVFTLRGKNLVLDGVTIQNWRPQSDAKAVVGVDIKGGSENVRLQNLHIHNLGTEGQGGNKAGWGSHGIRVMAEGQPIKNVSVQNCHLHDLKLGQHEAISFMAETADIQNPKVIGCDIRRVSNIGIVFEGSSRATVSNFEVRGNRLADSSSRSNPTYRGESSAAAIQVDSNVVVGNIHQNIITGADHGIVLESEKSGNAVRNIKITDNNFLNNRVAHVFADGSHHNQVAVAATEIINNRYTPNVPLLSKDRPERIRNVLEINNTPIR